MGDLADTGNDADETVRAQAAQQLYDAGIGFFPMRGNHEGYGTANSFAIPVFQTSYPQTRGLSNTFGATNFSSPTSLSTELDGMTYSFDDGARASLACRGSSDMESLAAARRFRKVILDARQR